MTVAAALCGALAAMLRNNMAYAAIVWLVLWLPAMRKKGKAAAIAMALALVLGLGGNAMLKAATHAVDGDIEAVYPFEDSVGVICNEEGKLRGLPANRALRDEDGHIYDVIAGSFLVVGLGEEDFCSLSAEQIDKFEALFHQPEAFVKMGHSITAIPIPDSVLQARDEHRDAPKLTHSSHDDR